MTNVQREKMIAYQRMLFRKKKTVLLLMAAVTVFMGSRLFHISVESRTEMWFNADDPHYVRYLDFKKEFGNDHILVVGIISHERPYKELKSYIEQLTESLKGVEGVRSAVSIFDFTSLGMRAEPIKRLLDGFFLSRDRRATQIIVQVTEQGSQILRGKIIDETKKIIATGRPKDCEIHLSGSLYLGAEMDRYARKNAGKAILFTLIAIALILLVLYRNISIVFSVLLTGLVAVIWAMGFYAFMGNSLNLVTNMITPLVLILAISVGIHIVCSARNERRNSRSWQESIIAGISTVWRPCFLASLTTSIGFFSLYFSPSKAISRFGLYAGLAMLFEFFVFFHFFPLILHVFHKPKSGAGEERNNGFQAFIAWNARAIASHTNGIILIFLLATAILSVGVLRITVDTNQLKYFGPDNDIVKSAKFFDEFFDGVYPVQVVIVSPGKGTFRNRQALQKIREFQEKAAEVFRLSRELSLADVVLSLDSKTFDKGFGISFLQNHSSRLLSNLVDKEFQKTVVTFRMPSGISSKDMMKMQSELIKIAGSVFGKSDLQVEMTGIMPLYAHFHEYIIKTQVISFSIAFTVIILVIGATFRSLSLLLAVVFANLTSIVMIFGLMGFFGINLDAGTVMIASCAIGIIVDDTIHILHRAGSELKNASHDYDAAIRATIEVKGRALVTTSLTVGLGFLVLLANDFKPAKFFGILMAFTMFSALVADMLLLPCLIRRFSIKIKKFCG